MLKAEFCIRQDVDDGLYFKEKPKTSDTNTWDIN